MATHIRIVIPIQVQVYFLITFIRLVQKVRTVNVMGVFIMRVMQTEQANFFILMLIFKTIQIFHFLVRLILVLKVSSPLVSRKNHVTVTFVAVDTSLKDQFLLVQFYEFGVEGVSSPANLPWASQRSRGFLLEYVIIVIISLHEKDVLGSSDEFLFLLHFDLKYGVSFLQSW